MVWLKFFKQFPMRQAYNKHSTQTARNTLGDAVGSVCAPPTSLHPHIPVLDKRTRGFGGRRALPPGRQMSTEILHWKVVLSELRRVTEWFPAAKAILTQE